MGDASPVLRTEAPGVAAFGRLVIISSMGAIVLSVEEDDVDTYLCGLCLQLAGYLEEYAYATGSIVCAEDRGMVELWIGVSICPRTTIPMGAEEHALLQLGLVGADDVACCEYGAIIGA